MSSLRTPIRVRDARAGEYDALSALAFRSKGAWGYDSAFLDRCRGALTVGGRHHSVRLAEQDGEVLGFYALEGADPVELDLLFVEPAFMRRGIGERLLSDALDCAGALTLTSDPHAEAFYLARGAERAGRVRSTAEANRWLPILTLSAAGFRPALPRPHRWR